MALTRNGTEALQNLIMQYGSLKPVAKRFGVEVSTLRWWEKRGLLVPSGRESGRRARLAACEEQQVRLRSAVGGLPIAHGKIS